MVRYGGNRVRVVFSPDHAQHDPQFFIHKGAVTRCPEQPERAERLIAAVLEDQHRPTAPRDHGPGPRAAVHTPDYLRFLEDAHRQWSSFSGMAPEIVPNVHPSRYAATYPASIIGRAGWHMADTACPIGAGTWPAACAAADTAVEAAALLASGERFAYALCRPPGHHAFADMAGGFCFLNNTAIAAAYLRQDHRRVAILDVDVHHGNGTQGIFYARGDVLHVSLHRDPVDYYPFFWGYAHERGEGAGVGATLNIPLPHETGDDAYLTALEDGLAAIRAFAPGALVVALGLDAHEDDPLRGLKVTTPGFARIGARIAGLGLPTVFVQEGGYLCDALAGNLISFLRGVEGRA